jgi:Xaa-Pro aminopeptidase
MDFGKTKNQEIINKLRNFMTDEGLDCMLVPSTDEYLNEYVDIDLNSRYYVTGFTGSTGDALVTSDKIYLFVDGRYHQQSDNEVKSDVVTVVKLNPNETQTNVIIGKISENIKQCKTLGIISSKINCANYLKLDEVLSPLKIKIKQYDFDPVESFAKISKNPKTLTIRKIPSEISGETAEKKLNRVIDSLAELNADCILLTKPEEVAWLTNLRSDEIPFSSSFKAKAVINKQKCIIFTDADIKKYLENGFELRPKDGFQESLSSLKYQGIKIGIDINSINLFSYELIKKTGNNPVNLTTNPVALMKAIKNRSELFHIKEIFLKTDIVVSRVQAWLNQSLDKNGKITEKQLSEQVKKYFKEEGAYGLSFEVIASGGKNTSIVHYTNPSCKKTIKKGDLVLLDCGAYFEGGYATDITRTFLAGTKVKASKKQKKIYTTVLKAFLNGLNHPVNTELSGYDIDNKVRKIINENPNKGFVFSHGTGHGVGISVHEDPPRISFAQSAKAKLEAGMCFTIEPGIYNPDWGGVRLENTVYLSEEKGKKKIISLSKSAFDEKLIDYSMLNDQEKEWLNEYQHGAIR